MPVPTPLSLSSRLASNLAGSNLAVLLPRRAEHSRTGWQMAAAGDCLYQPQDGAQPVRSRMADLGTRLRRMAGEPDDARLTGSTRSLGRRLSGLNLNLARLKTPPAAAATPRKLLGATTSLHAA